MPLTLPPLLRRVIPAGRHRYPRNSVFGPLVYRSRGEVLAAHGHDREDVDRFAEALAANRSRPAIPGLAGLEVAPLEASTATVIPERPNPLATELPWSRFRGLPLARSGLRKPVQKALTVLEYRDVCLAATGNKFSIFRGGRVDPSSSAILENQQAVAAHAEPLALAAFCDDVFAGAGNPAHFVCDRLTRAWVFTRLLGLPAAACAFGGVASPYARFALARVCPGARTLAADRVYRVARLLVLSSTGTYGGHPFYYLNPGAMAFVVPPLLEGLPPPAARRRLYLARTDAATRALVDEPALIAALTAEGFEIHEMGRHPPERQLQLVREAATVVAPHGAALTNLVAAHDGTHVVELFHPERGTTGYMALAERAGARYEPIIGEKTRSRTRRTPWTVDVDAVLRAVR